MRLDNFDLNLLVALDALLTEKSVSAAAEKMGVSQPAMSDTLKRLRDHFEDKLLVAAGRQMFLTPKAKSLVEPVRNALLQAKSVLTEKTSFDPATSTRKFSVVTSDYTMEVSLFEIIRRVSELAPGVQFDCRALRDGLDEIIPRGTADLIIIPHQFLSKDHPTSPLFEDDFVAIAWTGNKQIKDGLTKQLYFDLGHVIAVLGSERRINYREWFMKESRSRRPEVIVGSFVEQAKAIIGTDRIATVQRRLATIQAKSLPISLYPLPVSVTPLKEVLQWHAANSYDPGLKWLMEIIRSYARSPSFAEFPKGASDVPLETRPLAKL